MWDVSLASNIWWVVVACRDMSLPYVLVRTMKAPEIPQDEHALLESLWS